MARSIRNMARTGKIASLPADLREEANRRKLGGATGREIIAWLNANPSAQARLRERFADEWRISDQNWSDWFKGGYADWLRRRDGLELTKERAQFALSLAKNGQGISDGAAAILAGEILEALEDMGASDDKPARLQAAERLTAMLVKIRPGDHAAAKLRQDDQRLAQSADKLQLDWERFKTLAAEKMLEDALRRRAEEIAGSDLNHAQKIAAMRAAAFADVDDLEASGEVKIPQ
jgi:hypothetical protein